MKTIAVILYASLFCLSARSQIPKLAWVKQISGQGGEQGVRILPEDNGNTISIGQFDLPIAYYSSGVVVNLDSKGGRDIQVRSSGAYWLKVTDNNGCSSTETIVVSTKECPKGVNIPTAFTPNNDGKNDVFKALIYQDVKSFKLQVFDRWGQLVFQTSDPSNGWHGSYKGAVLTSSVFVWQCRFQPEGQKPEFQKGTLTLIKLKREINHLIAG